MEILCHGCRLHNSQSGHLRIRSRIPRTCSLRHYSVHVNYSRWVSNPNDSLPTSKMVVQVSNSGRPAVNIQALDAWSSPLLQRIPAPSHVTKCKPQWSWQPRWPYLLLIRSLQWPSQRQRVSIQFLVSHRRIHIQAWQNPTFIDKGWRYHNL